MAPKEELPKYFLGHYKGQFGPCYTPPDFRLSRGHRIPVNILTACNRGLVDFEYEAEDVTFRFVMGLAKHLCDDSTIIRVVSVQPWDKLGNAKNDGYVLEGSPLEGGIGTAARGSARICSNGEEFTELHNRTLKIMAGWFNVMTCLGLFVGGCTIDYKAFAHFVCRIDEQTLTGLLLEDPLHSWTPAMDKSMEMLDISPTGSVDVNSPEMHLRQIDRFMEAIDELGSFVEPSDTVVVIPTTELSAVALTECRQAISHGVSPKTKIKGISYADAARGKKLRRDQAEAFVLASIGPDITRRQYVEFILGKRKIPRKDYAKEHGAVTLRNRGYYAPLLQYWEDEPLIVWDERNADSVSAQINGLAIDKTQDLPE